jgi:3-deoxy-manno-octulosonate cytidylyltransferase (CMP-KDO synthetase)
MRIAAVIPARWASSRLPGKPLATIGRLPMILHVYERAKAVPGFETVVIATDSEKIMRVAIEYGAPGIMTSSEALSGTDRIAEASKHEWLKDMDYIVNIQGDEPLIEKKTIEQLIGVLNGATEIATLVKRITSAAELHNPNVVKAVKNWRGDALYFSRHPIPYLRGIEVEHWIDKGSHFKHIGMYAYRRDILLKLAALAPGQLEQAESLEQLRWLENGFSIKTVETDAETIGVDTPEDLERVRGLIDL